MTDDQKISTNRLNARHSTGPKSRHGKARSSKNALRHGLSIPIDQLSTLKDQRDEVAKKISADNGLSDDHASEISTALIMLRRIRREKVRFFSTLDLPDALQRGQSMTRYEKEARARIFRALKAL